MRRTLHLITSALIATFLVQCGDDTITNNEPINLDTFAITIGGEEEELASAVVATSDGGIVMAGAITRATEASDGLVMRVDSDGVVQWQQRYEGSGAQKFSAVIQTANGDIAAVGSSGPDFFVVRLTATGTKLWDETFDVGLFGEGASIVETSSGEFLLVGTAFGSLAEIDKQLIKISASGQLLWSRVYDDGLSEGALAIAATGDANHVIAGYFVSSQTRAARMQIIKIDSTGEILWSNDFGTAQDTQPEDMIILPDGRIAVAGWTLQSSGGTTRDIYVLVLTEDGDLIDGFQLGGAYYDDAKALTYSDDGKLVITGRVVSSSGGVPSDLYLFQLSLDGVIEWEFKYGGEFDEQGADVTIVGDRIFVAGQSDRGNNCCSDIYLLKTDLNGQL